MSGSKSLLDTSMIRNTNTDFVQMPFLVLYYGNNVLYEGTFVYIIKKFKHLVICGVSLPLQMSAHPSY